MTSSYLGSLLSGGLGWMFLLMQEVWTFVFTTALDQFCGFVDALVGLFATAMGLQWPGVQAFMQLAFVKGAVYLLALCDPWMPVVEVIAMSVALGLFWVVMFVARLSLRIYHEVPIVGGST